jgi:hypothetical protein
MEPELPEQQLTGAVAAASRVTPVSGAPVAISDHFVTTENEPLDVSAPGLIANDIDLDGGTIIAANFFSPSHGTLTSIVTSGAFTYVPDPGFVGTDEFSYRIRDDNDNFSDYVAVTIQVLADPNRPPLVIQDEYATLKDTPLAVTAPGLIGNDIDPDGDTIIAANFFSPSHGTLTSIVTSGAFNYEPDPGFVGTDQFSYRIRDDGNAFSEYDTVTIRVLIDDFTPPEIVVPAEPLLLWPPKHAYQSFAVGDLVAAVNDAGDPSLTPGDVKITRVTCDEAADDLGAGVMALGDIVINPLCNAVRLMAERDGGGNGRVYVIDLAVEDANGNVGTASVRVHVPPARPRTSQEDAAAQIVNAGCMATALSSSYAIGPPRSEK